MPVEKSAAHITRFVRLTRVLLAITAPVWLTLAASALLGGMKSAPRAGLLSIIAIAGTLNAFRVAGNLVAR